MFVSSVYLSDFCHFLVFGNLSIYIAGLPNRIAGLLGDKHSTNICLPIALGEIPFPRESSEPTSPPQSRRALFLSGPSEPRPIPSEYWSPARPSIHPRLGRNSFSAEVFGAGIPTSIPASFVFVGGPRSPAKLGAASGGLAGRERNDFRSLETENRVPGKNKASKSFPQLIPNIPKNNLRRKTKAL